MYITHTAKINDTIITFLLNRLEMHYNPVIARLKELVKSGEIGEIKSFNATNITPSPVWEVFPKRMEVNITINGEKGSILSDCFGPNVYHNGAPNDRYTVQYTYFDEWVGLIDEFVENIRSHRTPLINLEWHKKTIEAMNACYESIASGRPVKL